MSGQEAATWRFHSGYFIMVNVPYVLSYMMSLGQKVNQLLVLTLAQLPGTRNKRLAVWDLDY